MYRYLLIGYIVIYTVFAILLFVAHARIVPEEQKAADESWETPVDLILVAVGLAGMLFLVTDMRSNTLTFIWRPVSIVVATMQFYLNLKDRLQLFRSGEAKKGDVEVRYVDISVILFLLPSICLNLYYAFR